MQDNTMYDAMVAHMADNHPEIQMRPCNPQDIVFDDHVKLQCFYCARYNASWRCPPRIPQLDYENLIKHFAHAAFVWLDLPMTKESYAEVRNESSVNLHYAILELEKILLQNNISVYWSFIGGSCKLCKSGCGKERCNNPYQARIPLEATGVNVVETAAKYDINITFPATTHLMRIGMILW